MAVDTATVAIAPMSEPWLALIIGNTRLHWGFFYQETLNGVWHTPHLTAHSVEHLVSNGFKSIAWQSIETIETTVEITVPLAQSRCLNQAISLSSLWIASAVPTQTALWRSLNDSVAANIVERSQIPLSGLYPTLGIDRAINLLGAGNTVGWPALVIDSGTALTFTAGVQQSGRNALYGGAILPGIRLQAQSLAQQTAALGEFVTTADAILPERWATDTAGAIASGLTYSTTSAIIDYLSDWWQHFPAGKAVLTGGDGPVLYALLQQRAPAIAARVQMDSYLMFWGMQAYRKGRMLAV